MTKYTEEIEYEKIKVMEDIDKKTKEFLKKLKDSTKGPKLQIQEESENK